MDAIKSNVLIVDDEPASAEPVKQILEDSGVEVMLAPSVEQALTLLEDQTPDLVLVDVILPGADGYSLVKILREDDRWSAIPILLISGKTFPTSLQGADGFLKKPFSKKELFAAVGRFIQVDYSL